MAISSSESPRPLRDTARAMSQENVEIVRAAFRAFEAKDSEAWVNCFHPNVELLLPRNVLEGGSYRGHEGARRAFADAFETWAAFHFEIQDIREVDDRVIVLGRTTAVGKGDAPAVEYQSANLCKMGEGKIVYFRPYQSHHEALEAVGLSE
jgi:ketosteroid isomerase-like protein